MQSTFPDVYQIRQAALSDAPELARLRWDFSDQAGQTFEIFSVEPFARNQGIGSHMLRTIQQWAQSQNIEFFIVWPAEESVNFYHKNGFVPNQEILECDVAPLTGEVLI